MVFRQVGIVMGGTSAERDMSIRSGNAVAQALEDKGYPVQRVMLQPGEDWVAALRDAQVDAAFLALHGRLGEDGCVQGLCEVLGIPYTGSSVLASALAIDKAKSKELFRQHGIPTPGYYTIGESGGASGLAERHGAFGFPVIVKPRSEGPGVGMSKATNLQELRAAISKALEHDDVAIVERFIAGREVHVGVLDGRVLGAIEVAPHGGIYDYESKYTPGMTDYFMPARLNDTRYRGVLTLAERAAQVLGCTGACRVGMIVTEAENEYVLEVNTLPAMTESSLISRIAGAAGYDFGALCETMLAGARLHVSPMRTLQSQIRRLPVAHPANRDTLQVRKVAAG